VELEGIVGRSADCGERIQKASLFLLASAILGGCGTVKPRGFFSAERLALNAKRKTLMRSSSFQLNTYDRILSYHVRPTGGESPNFTGQLLVAHPSLRDPNFRRTILFLSTHDPDEGAHGLVINRPTNKNLGEFLPDQELEKLRNVPVYLGGPVGTQELTIVSFQLDPGDSKMTFHSPGSLESLEEFKEDELGTLRAFVGYAGWTSGQLEFELEQSAWLIMPATEEILREQAGDKVWLELMKDLGPAYYVLAMAPDDPSLN
jgi:putative transcriptional regulator